MSDAKVIFLPSMSLSYEDNVLESVEIGGETFCRKQRDWRAVARAHELTIGRLRDENAKLREELDQWRSLTAGIELPEHPMTQFHPKDLERENAKLREACAELLEMAESHDPEWLHWPEMYEELRKLGVEVC